MTNTNKTKNLENRIAGTAAAIGAAVLGPATLTLGYELCRNNMPIRNYGDLIPAATIAAGCVGTYLLTVIAKDYLKGDKKQNDRQT